MREIIRQKQLKQDLKRMAKSGRYQIDDLRQVIMKLARGIPLSKKYCDHSLSGQLEGF